MRRYLQRRWVVQHAMKNPIMSICMGSSVFEKHVSKGDGDDKVFT